ncbi:GrpB family protein [Allorhizobium taibaishanense]|uniref:GrpB-like predicted nucleotidyltransferase (UPF0157 family) n=1 Tax=Allorhizobium taibaishanense TaxID=887144 RepID=A0A1Q9A455_9HYPH|nr:GrpB family protein [Allorhizobium taibaishanense]MBB4006359.1 GrpB-like predicted nucleotidyltransferase (UPF0157 family) [Allorhizobium taibaishanense]OLP49312.1 hypothetical protein BJF91_19860 [Allorhizobium taibaishanense]
MSIQIVPPRPEWATEFKVISETLTEAFGTLAVRIEHIGSTSVPGLAAKDIVDVQVSVHSLDLPEDISTRLSRLGFNLFENIWRDHVPPNEDPNPELWTKRYAKSMAGTRAANVHIRRLGAPNERYPRLFRDYLRACPAAVATYALIKRELAARHSDDLDAYYAIKDPVCDLIIGAAEQWAVEHWIDQTPQ